jgi:hypothetical protein
VSARSELARARLQALRGCPVAGHGAERIRQHLDAWLEVATGAEVRRAWSRHWGKLPGWAAA